MSKSYGYKIGRAMSKQRNKTRKELLQRDGDTCYYCPKQCHRKDPLHKDYATIDHKIPKSKGGLSTSDNLVIACLECNQAKGDMTAEEFIAERENANIQTY